METKNETKTISIDEELCTGCGDCADMCPRGILYVDEETNLCKVTDQSLCDRLGGCENACPTEAIAISRD